MEIIDYDINYYTESYLYGFSLILFFVSLFILAFLLTKDSDQNDNTDIDAKLLLLDCKILFFSLISIFLTYNFTKKPYLSIKYINTNINQKIIKSKNEILNNIINGNIVPEYNDNDNDNHLKYYTYEFKISQEDANQIENKKEEFDKKKKEIKDNGNIKFVD